MEYCLKFTVDKKTKVDVLNFLRNYSQLSWFKNINDDWLFDLISTNKQKLIDLKKHLILKFTINDTEIFLLPKNDWIKKNQENEKTIVTKLFSISQYGNNAKVSKRKFFLCIPASTSFGTGQHVSTLLCIEEIEFLLKKYLFNNFLDIGTGSGILSLVIGKITNKRVYSSDLDKLTKQNLLINMQVNNYKKISIINCTDLLNYQFRGKKFDLIVSNILLNPLIKLAKSISQQSKQNGYLILSGILQSQILTVYKYYYNFNFRLIKKRVVDGWAVIILKKNGK